MDSFIKSPESHMAAVKNPALKGGPFVDFDASHVPAVEALRDRTLSRRKHLLDLSRAIGELDAILASQATGYSLEPLYDQVPEPLRGYVELVYDLHNRPGFRLLEALLYRSKYYDRSLQTVLLSTITVDDRPFVLSTPRLTNDRNYEWGVPFDSPAIDRFCELKTRPAPYHEIKDMLQVPDDKDPLVRRFFSEEPAPRYRPYEGPGARWRYFGHACILFETRNVSVLLDPVLSYTYESGISRYTYDDLPEKIDFALVTHNHQDHILIETLLQLRHRIGTIVVPQSISGALRIRR